MNAETRQSVAAPHVYRTKLTPMFIFWWLVFIFFVAFLSGGMDWLLYRTPAHASSVRALIWAVVYVSVMYWMAWGGLSLTIYSDAFVYRRNGMAIQADWREVERIKRRWWPYPLRGGDQLILRRNRHPRRWKGWLYGAQSRTVPLSVFDPHWREGPLGDDLRAFAPHLFDPA